ncbi:uncharacterized protein YhhL (DUF1145 family) [Actinokineospora baliensis]|uniref:DUF998 domain-containing protein n=1 Tax=Actinokineospora baliensis TaxID=547056 RepID=UPI00195A8334|nr:DUF998 domain-containing protein [Actinokineospora baliensis]MBM7773294.1 uncharacterized protein YhhL (DUF1145 family) [Actinokineospora baliensis]
MVATPTHSPHDTLVHSYLFLRRAIGAIGIGLPVVLVVGNLVLGDGLRASISGYYYSDVRDVMVGAMCAVGVFLLSYRGYEPIDNVVSNLAALGAVGVAIFPTAPAHPMGGDGLVSTLHLISSVVFFLSLAYFSLVLFRRSDDPTPTPAKIARNRVYLVCGVIMLACLALLATSVFLFDGALADLKPALWLESIAILAFGVSWLTKGEAILSDHQH